MRPTSGDTFRGRRSDACAERSSFLQSLGHSTSRRSGSKIQNGGLGSSLSSRPRLGRSFSGFSNRVTRVSSSSRSPSPSSRDSFMRSASHAANFDGKLLSRTSISAPRLLSLQNGGSPCGSRTLGPTSSLPSITERMRSWQTSAQQRRNSKTSVAKAASATLPDFGKLPASRSCSTPTASPSEKPETPPLPIISHERCFSRGKTMPVGDMVVEDATEGAGSISGFRRPRSSTTSKRAGPNPVSPSACSSCVSPSGSRTRKNVFFDTSDDESGRRRHTLAFYKVAKGDTVVPSDVKSLMQVWAHAGYNYSVNVAWLRDIVETQVSGRSMLDLDDFYIVWGEYMKRMTNEQREAFGEVAQEDAGGRPKESLKVAALPGLLLRLGMQPMEGALDEMLVDVGCRWQSNLEIDYETFHRIYSELYSRAGLSRQECLRIRGLFDQNTVDGKNVIRSSSLHKILQLHRLLVGKENSLVSDTTVEYLIKEIVSQVNEVHLTLEPQVWRRAVDSGPWRNYDYCDIDWPAFCLVVCVLHNYIAEAVQGVIADCGIDGKSEFNTKELLVIFDEIGSVSSTLSTVLEECKAKIGIQDSPTATFSDLYTLLLGFCEVEGMSQAERTEIEKIFSFFTTECRDVELGEQPGTVRSSEVMRALRFLCYRPSSYRFYEFMENRGDSDTLYCSDLIKAVADYRAYSVSRAKYYFRKPPGTEGGSAIWHSAHASMLKEILSSTGHRATDEEIAALEREAEQVHAKTGEIDWTAFLQLEVSFRESQKESAKANMGFTAAEIAELREEFNKKDPRGHGFILVDSLERLIESRFPEVNFDAGLRTLVQDSDDNGDGRTQFDEYCWLVQRLKDRVTKETVNMAIKIRKELGLSKDEVKDLRELFNEADADLSGLIDLEELMSVLSRLIYINREAYHELAGMMNEVDRTGRGELDFWEFLRLMKILHDQNWRNLNNVASKAIGRPCELQAT